MKVCALTKPWKRNTPVVVNSKEKEWGALYCSESPKMSSSDSGVPLRRLQETPMGVFQIHVMVMGGEAMIEVWLVSTAPQNKVRVSLAAPTARKQEMNTKCRIVMKAAVQRRSPPKDQGIAVFLSPYFSPLGPGRENRHFG
jgi:hypothetical protein